MHLLSHSTTAPADTNFKIDMSFLCGIPHTECAVWTGGLSSDILTKIQNTRSFYLAFYAKYTLVPTTAVVTYAAYMYIL